MEHTEAVQGRYNPAMESRFPEKGEATPENSNAWLFGVLGLTAGVAFIIFGVLLSFEVVSLPAFDLSSSWAHIQGWFSSMTSVAPAPEAPVAAPAVVPDSNPAVAPVVARCAATAADPQLAQVTTKIVGMTEGPFATLLSLSMLLMGAVMGIIKQSPLPALTAVMGAAMLRFGPAVIFGVLGC